MKLFIIVLAFLMFSAPALSADAPLAQGPPLPERLTIYFVAFTGGTYEAVTPENIRSGSPRFVVMSRQYIRDLYHLLGGEARPERFETGSTRLRVDDGHGAALFLVDTGGVVRAGGREYALGSNDFLRLDHLVTFLLAEDRRLHPLPPPPKPPKEPALIDAVWTHDLPRVKALLAKGAPADTKDSDGNTALVVAVMEKQAAMVELLLARGADPNAHERNGQPALHWAVGSRDASTVRLLLGRGADVNAKDEEGQTSLMDAAIAGDAAMARVLLAHKARTDLADDYGQTALMRAARNGHIEVVKVLLSHGADPDLQTEEGRTALKAAQEGGRQEIIELLQKASGH